VTGRRSNRTELHPRGALQSPNLRIPAHYRWITVPPQITGCQWSPRAVGPPQVERSGRGKSDQHMLLIASNAKGYHTALTRYEGTGSNLRANLPLEILNS